MKETPNYFAIIPANVRYDKELRANEKLMYGEITALSNKTGECWASNQYFADLYSVTPQAVSTWINNLKKRGYISVEIIYKDGTKEIEKRVLKITEVSTNVEGGINKSLRGYQQKFKDNNIKDNNTRIIKIPPTIEEVKAYCNERRNNINAEQFIDYYESKGWLVGKTKMKDWRAAVRTWERNGFSNAKKNDGFNNCDQRETDYSKIEELLMKRN